MNQIDVSIVMSVYNTKKEYLIEAIESIIHQTFKNWEFIIIDDGSDPYVHDTIASYKDERIIEVKNENNIGLTKSLNIGLRKACGKYIARMDADDVSYPDRLLLQYQYMETHPEIAVVGCWVKMGKRTEKVCGRVSSEWRKARMLFDNVGIFHPTAFMRRDFLVDNNLFYDEKMKRAQDYDLWIRLLSYGKMGVLPKRLLNYRVHKDQISIRNSLEQYDYNIEARNKLLATMGVTLTVSEQKMFNSINQMIGDVEIVESMFSKIIEANKRSHLLDEKYLMYEMITKEIRFFIQNRDSRKIILRVFRGDFFRLDYWLYMILIFIKKCF